jgi:hypothetical protein
MDLAIIGFAVLHRESKNSSILHNNCITLSVVGVYHRIMTIRFCFTDSDPAYKLISSKQMRLSLKLLLTALLIQSALPCMAQVADIQDDTREVKTRQSEPVTEKATENPDIKQYKQDKNTSNQKGSVKQVKSARPDMSKTRGARPPDIVRPSGSRIPKGVGRPAGAVKHGR